MATKLGHGLRTALQSPIIAALGVVSLAQPLLEATGLVAAPAPPEEDLRGKRVLVTGATAGIGLATAARLARMGAEVVVTGRDEARLAAAVRTVAGGRGRVTGEVLDLCALASVRACAARLGAFDVVVLNAGTNANVPTAEHADMPGCSLVFGVNFVAQWLLLKLLTLRPGARVVCLSSVSHHSADAATFGTAGADYAESKLAMILLARAISRGDFGAGLVGVAVNPGAVDSHIWRHVWFPASALFAGFSRLAFLSSDEGSATSVFAAAAPAACLPRTADGLPAYLAPFWQPPRGPGRSAFEYLSVFVGARPAFARLPRDERAAADRLWAACARLVGAM